MALSVGGRRGGLVSEINVTPMADIMIVLLIIFMVVTPVATRGLDTALPQPAPPTTLAGPPPPSLVLGLGREGLTLNRTPVASLEDLEARLRQLFETRSDRTLFVHAAPQIPYGRVVEAMDVARGAGADRIGILPAQERR